VLVMFTAMVGGPLIVARQLNLKPEQLVDMVSGTMIGCGLATMVSALGVGFIGPRLPIVMGVFYIFIGPLVAISKEVSLAAAMTALMIGGLVQFAWSPLIGRMHRFFPAIVTGTDDRADRHRPHEDRHQAWPPEPTRRRSASRSRSAWRR
jgi:NCS2 family nucleobase:cation symporter-2